MCVCLLVCLFTATLSTELLSFNGFERSVRSTLGWFEIEASSYLLYSTQWLAGGECHIDINKIQQPLVTPRGKVSLQKVV